MKAPFVLAGSTVTALALLLTPTVASAVEQPIPNAVAEPAPQATEVPVPADVVGPEVAPQLAEPVAGWSSASSIRFLAFDEGGVASLWVSLDGVVRSVEGGWLDVVLPGSGEHSLEYWAFDTVGNRSETGSLSIRLDRDAPVITGPALFDVEPLFAAGSYELEVGEEAWVEYRCDDVLSGVLSCTAPLPSHSLLDTSVPGSFTFEVVAHDNAFNLRTSQISYTVVAPTEPTGPTAPTDPTAPAAPVVPDASVAAAVSSGTVPPDGVRTGSLALTGAPAPAPGLTLSALLTALGASALLVTTLVRRRRIPAPAVAHTTQEIS